MVRIIAPFTKPPVENSKVGIVGVLSNLGFEALGEGTEHVPIAPNSFLLIAEGRGLADIFFDGLQAQNQFGHRALERIGWLDDGDGCFFDGFGRGGGWRATEEHKDEPDDETCAQANHDGGLPSVSWLEVYRVAQMCRWVASAACLSNSNQS